MKVNRLFLITLAMACSLPLLAQHNEEVTIEGTYRPKVNKVDKILMEAETPQPSYAMPSSEVRVLEIEHRFPLQLEKLSALNYNGKDMLTAMTTKNFLMAGIGTHLSPVFLYKHNSMISKTLGIGVGVKHFSSWLGIKDYAPSGFMNNAFEVGVSSSKFNNLQLNANVYYKNDIYHYYGVNTTQWTGGETLLGQVTPRQTYNTIGTNLSLASTSTRSRELLHRASFDYHYLFTAFRADEHVTELEYGLSYVNNWWGSKTHPQKVGADVDFLFNAFQPASLFTGTELLPLGQRQVWFELNPYFEMKDDYYRLHLGFRTDVVGPLQNCSRLSVRPDLQGSLFVMDKKVEFYAGLNGGRRPYTFTELVEENPFLLGSLELGIKNVKLGFDGGVRTNVMNTLDLHLGIRYRHTGNDLFYKQLDMPSPSEGFPYNSFGVVYDETRTVSVLTNARWLALDKLTVDAGFTYNNCSPSEQAHAWYRPTTEGILKVDYQFDDALSMNASFLYQGGLWARTGRTSGLTPVDVKLPNVFDFGIGADYKVKDELTVFAKVENLLHQKYQRFLDYPVTGIEFFAGVKMRF